MIDTKRLRGEIVASGMTQRDVAEAIGVHEATFYRKMKVGIFNNDEIEKITELLNIKNPTTIFFANSVSFQATSSK